jgi:hypothetical protein
VLDSLAFFEIRVGELLKVEGLEKKGIEKG